MSEKTRKIVYKKYPDWELEIAEIGIKSKTVNGQRLTHVHWADYIPKKHDPIIKKHNDLIRQLEQIENEIRQFDL
jgi:hypothetical protein